MESKTTDKFIAMLGFSRRSGKIVYGLDGLKSAKGVRLLAVSDTASDNLLRSMERLAAERNIPLIYAASLETVVGNNVKALGLTDRNMAKAVTDYVGNGTPQYTIKYGARR